MSHTDGATKKSLFIQCSWGDLGELREQLEHIRLYHKDKTKDDYIHNVVLDEIGTSLGLHRQRLDIIAPYLPGGSLKTFDNVFVGSHFVKWMSGGSAYSVGMTSGIHRWANLRVQRQLWAAFKSRYPNTPFHFYINHEGVLSYFDVPNIRRGYEAYLIQAVRDAEVVMSNRAILWSPAILSGKSLSNAEELGVKTVFANVRYQGKKIGRSQGGVNWLHLQDMMGRARPDVTIYDVKNWYNELRRMNIFDSLRVNMEMFTIAYGRVVPQDPAIIQSREDWYQRNGVRLGASWEIRQWYLTHADL